MLASVFNPPNVALYLIKRLIQKRADVNAKQTNGKTALHLLAQHIDFIREYPPLRNPRAPRIKMLLEAFRVLIKAGADTTMTCDSGLTPIQCAFYDYYTHGRGQTPVGYLRKIYNLL